MNEKEDRIFRQLEGYAKYGVGIRSSRHAAAIVHKNKIIARGRNSYKTHPAMKLWGKNSRSLCLHAEIAAIIEFIKNYPPQFASKCDLYVLRLNKKNEVCESKPCKGCQKAIDFYKFNKVVWT